MEISKQTFAEDERGNQVLLMPGDTISEITDAGPVHVADYCCVECNPEPVSGWNVTFRFVPKHKLWDEIVTMDAVKLLKALED